jgi:ketosteroid isomerase-like protein
MRAFASAVALLVLLSSASVAGPREDALQVLEEWAKAFTDSDVDAIVKLHAPDALFMGTASKGVVTQTAGVRAYFENALLNNRPRSAKLTDYKVLVLSDSAVAVSGLDLITGVRDGSTFSASGRATFVIAKRGADWQIVQFHRSPIPN